MWDEARALFEAHRAALARAGIPLAARIEPDTGLMCTYSAGVIRLRVSVAWGYLDLLLDPEDDLDAFRSDLLLAG
ncbi:hypothetical protein WME90_28735 [Sorangium sp. So ce375]|uniref:hypothetical protein n=1 Tax=Sorangium sp. So ce375 TaxID=3133306 RepID=UPI003F5C5CC7